MQIYLIVKSIIIIHSTSFIFKANTLVEHTVVYIQTNTNKSCTGIAPHPVRISVASL